MLQKISGQQTRLYTRLEFSALIITTIVLVIAVVALVLAPVLAWQWSRLPFPGFNVEPTLHVSSTFNPDWAGFQKGLNNLDRLVAVDGKPVPNGTSALNDILRSYQVGQTVTFDFIKIQTGQRVQIPLPLTRFNDQDFVWFFLVPYLVGLSYLGIGLWVFRFRYRRPVGRVFALLCVGVALMTGVLFDLYSTHYFSWAWACGIPLAAGAMISLSLLFPQEQSLAARHKWLRWAPFAPAAVLMLYDLLTTYNMSNSLAYVWAWRLGYYYGGVGLVVFIGMMVYRRFSSPSPIVRRQSYIILMGTLVAFGPIVYFILRTLAGLPTNLLPWFYMLPLIMFPLAIAYAILRHRVFDVDLVVSRGISYAVLTGIIVAGYFLLINATSFLLRSAVAFDNPWVIAVFILIVAVLLDPIRNRLQYAVDKIFYRGRVDYRASLQAFSERLTEQVELDSILETLFKEINSALHPEAMWIYLYTSEAGGYVARSAPNTPHPPPGAVRFPPDSALVRVLGRDRVPVYIQADRSIPSELDGERSRLGALKASLFVPLRGRRSGSEHSLEGWMALGNTQSGRPYSNDDLDFLLALADQTTLALDKASIFIDLDRRVQELSVLSLISQALNFAMDADDIFELIYTQSGRIIDTANFYIALYDDRRRMLHFAFYVENGERQYLEEEWELGTGLTSEVVRTGQPIVTDDYLAECEKRGVVAGGTPGRAWMSVPLMSGNQVLGVINVSSFDPDIAYSNEQLQFFRAVADYTSNVLEKRQLYEEMGQRAHQLATLNEVGRTVSSTLDLHAALNLIIEKAAEILHAEAASLFLVDQETNELIFEVATGPTAPELLGTRMPKGKGIVGTVAETLEPTIVNDVASDPRWYKGYDKSNEFVTQTLIAVPMVYKDTAIGVIEVLNKADGTPFDRDDLNLLQAFAAQSAVAVENARLYTMTDEALATRVEELQTLQRIDRELNASLDVERALDLTVEWAMRMTAAAAGMLGVVTPEEDGLIMHAIHGYGQELEKYRTEPWPLDRGILGRVARMGFPNMVLDVSEDLDYIAISEGTQSQLTVPVLRENRVIGVITLESDQPSHFDLEDLNFVVRLADHAAIAISNSQLYEEVKRANEYKSEFVSIVAHELKLPMQNIKGYGDLMSKGIAGELTEMQVQFLGVIRTNVDRMNTLVSDLLDISRIETGRLQLNLKPTPIQEVVEDVLRTVKRTIEEKEQTIEVDVPEDLPLVIGDKSRLIQILTNMVSNAYKYTPNGGHICVRVQQETIDGREYAVCAVKDNGVGISQEDVARLGQKFFRASDQRVRDVPGHGLGLSIVKNLIQMHGGELRIESEVGVGSTFSFNVPLANGVEQTAGPESAT